MLSISYLFGEQLIYVFNFRAYFNGTQVECVLVGRAKQEGVLASEFVGTCYTHHQVTGTDKATKAVLY